MAELKKISGWARLILICALSGVIGGCSYYKAFKELKEYEKLYGLVGVVSTPSGSTQNAIVVLYSGRGHSKKIIQYAFPMRSGVFSFFVPEGTYRLSAFEDTNNNLKHDEGELGGHFGSPDKLWVSSETVDSEMEAIRGLDIAIESLGFGLGEDIHTVDVSALTRSAVLRVGQPATLGSSKFKAAKGRKGYWKPLEFLRDYGFGVYFLDPYDPGKVPVLFVHGATGTPRGWKSMVRQLDREKFQPWFFYYPSGLELNISAISLNKIIKELHHRHRFERLDVIAHSMGGLVARAFINQNILETEGRPYVNVFVSIATPWGGVKLAAKGVEKAPAAIPCWRDLDPQSNFLEALYKETLPPAVRFHMLFSYRGSCLPYMGNNDGTIELSSLLDFRAQSESNRMWGHDEDHDSILTSPAAISQIVAILNAAHAGPAAVDISQSPTAD